MCAGKVISQYGQGRMVQREAASAALTTQRRASAQRGLGAEPGPENDVERNSVGGHACGADMAVTWVRDDPAVFSCEAAEWGPF